MASLPKKIAIIEDDIALALMYEFKLRSSGYEVRIARDGREGLELIQEFNPFLILLDLRMPIMNGDEMLRKVRATEQGASLRVIVLTNISRDEAPMTLRFLKVDRYIVKAHNTPSQVLAVVKEIIG